MEIDGQEVDLTDENTTVYTFRDAPHMDHLCIALEDGQCSILFVDADVLRQFIDADFPLQTARWPRPFDFEAYDKYIEKLASDLNDELEGL